MDAIHQRAELAPRVLGREPGLAGLLAPFGSVAETDIV
jgi:hypothetical protein